MNIPILGSMGATVIAGSTSLTTTGDDEATVTNSTSTGTTLTTGALLLYNGYKDVKIDIELTNKYLDSLSDDELYQLEQKLAKKDEIIEINETHSKSI